MKKNTSIRVRAVSLLLALGLLSAVGCQSPSEGIPDTDGATIVEETTFAADTEQTTDSRETAAETAAAPDRELTIDGRYRIVIPAEADELTRETADKVAEAFLDKAGLELAIVTDAEAPSAWELVLGYTNRIEYDPVDDYALFLNGESVHFVASSGATLYAAADTVLETWLSADFGLKQDGGVTLLESRLVDLNSLSHRMSGSIKVMTQNLRDGNDGNGNNVPQRYERFCRLLADYRPDIIGTQEHSFDWYVRLNKLFSDMTGEEDIPKYGIVGESTTGSSTRAGGMNAILYREDRFELLGTETFWLSETPDRPSTMTGTSFKRICTWALLKDKQTEKTILAVNTHLDHLSETTRVAQIAVVMNFLQENVGDYPVFFTGDFNTTSSSETYGIVTEEFSDARGTAERNLSTVNRTFHNYTTGGWGSVIDHIFYNDKSTPVTYEILSKDYDGFVSDHYGVLVEFVLK